LKGYTNCSEPLSDMRYTINWLKSVRERYYNKIPSFDDILLITYMIFRSHLYCCAMWGMTSPRSVNPAACKVFIDAQTGAHWLYTADGDT